MRIGISSPYLNSLSGGERYMLTIAAHLSRLHEVDLFWDDPKILIDIQERLKLEVSKIHVRKNFFLNRNLIYKLYESKAYDVIFFLTDGSIPTSLAKHNILHFQVPFASINCPTYKRDMFKTVICNSLFTKEHLDPQFAKKSIVIYPPVKVSDFNPLQKKKQIITVGRFSSQYQAKKQDILIKSFIEGVKNHIFDDYTFVLVGGLLESDTKYFESLQKMASEYKIVFKPNCKYNEVQELYGTSQFYWHAAGYHEDKPEYMEHFGISTVESMSAGCIPLVYAAGGQKEIIHHSIDGMLWRTQQELLSFTDKLIHSPEQMLLMKNEAIKRSNDFSENVFCDAIDSVINSL